MNITRTTFYFFKSLRFTVSHLNVMFIFSLTAVKDAIVSEIFNLLHLSLTKTAVYQTLGCFIANLRQKLNKNSARCTE